MRRCGLAALLLSGALPACSPLGLLNATVSADGVTVRHAIAYGQGPRRMLDVYEPASAGVARPFVVFFYGGAWKFGVRGDYRFVGLALAKRGFVVAIPDYRLYPEVAFPGFMRDAAAATAFAARHAAEYGASDRPFVMGHSAGGYIALMLALNPAYLAADGLDAARLSGAIGLAGPYDFNPAEFPDIAPIFAAANEPTTQPIHYASGHAPPLLLEAGEADSTVRPYNARNLAAAVAADGGSVETRLYPGVGHIGLLLSLSPWFSGKAPALGDAVAFMAGHAG